jgi:hypothetical protein
MFKSPYYFIPVASHVAKYNPIFCVSLQFWLQIGHLELRTSLLIWNSPNPLLAQTLLPNAAHVLVLHSPSKLSPKPIFRH